MIKKKKLLTVKEARAKIEELENEVNRAKNRTADALASVRSLERTLDRTLTAAEAWMAQVRGYEAETASHMFIRSIKKFFEGLMRRCRKNG